MFPAELIQAAEQLSAQLRSAGKTLVTAESCTGGLIAGLMTEFSGSSAVFERGFVTYSNDAKHELLGVPETLLRQHGAVSQSVAEAMARGALARSNADISVAVTGIAGPDGGTAAKPVGLVHVAVALGEEVHHRECRFGDVGRAQIRMEAIAVALAMVERAVE